VFDSAAMGHIASDFCSINLNLYPDHGGGQQPAESGSRCLFQSSDHSFGILSGTALGDHPWSSFWFSNKQHYLSLHFCQISTNSTLLLLLSAVQKSVVLFIVYWKVSRTTGAGCANGKPFRITIDKFWHSLEVGFSIPAPPMCIGVDISSVSMLWPSDGWKAGRLRVHKTSAATLLHTNYSVAWSGG